MLRTEGKHVQHAPRAVKSSLETRTPQAIKRRDLLTAISAVILSDLFCTAALGINLQNNAAEIQTTGGQALAHVMESPLLLFLIMLVPLAIPVGVIGLTKGWGRSLKWYTLLFCAVACLFCARGVAKALWL